MTDERTTVRYLGLALVTLALLAVVGVVVVLYVVEWRQEW